jgi:membrane protein required for colicin V production
MNIALILDIGVIAVLLISAGVAFFRGFIRETLTILGMFGGSFAALAFGGSLVPYTSSWFGIEKGKDPGKLFDLIPMELAAQITAYAGVFIAVFIVLQLASYLISTAVQAMGLGPVDRTLGVFFGIARGILLLGVLYLPFHLILPEKNKQEWFKDSKTIVFVEATTNWLIAFAPHNAKSPMTIEDETRQKLSQIDILGDKRITQSDKQKSVEPEGYSDKARAGLETLIENKIDTLNAKNDLKQPQQEQKHE